MKKILFGLLLLFVISTGFVSSTNTSKSSDPTENNFIESYQGYITIDDATISIWANVGHVTKGAFGINVGAPYYTATGTMSTVNGVKTVTGFHMVANNVSFDYTGPLSQ